MGRWLAWMGTSLSLLSSVHRRLSRRVHVQKKSHRVHVQKKSHRVHVQKKSHRVHVQKKSHRVRFLSMSRHVHLLLKSCLVEVQLVSLSPSGLSRDVHFSSSLPSPRHRPVPCPSLLIGSPRFRVVVLFLSKSFSNYARSSSINVTNVSKFTPV